MKRITFSTGAVTLVIATLLHPAGSSLAATTEAVTNEDEQKRLRGEYLVTTSACNDCHTPWIMGPNGPEMDTSRKLSGHPESLAVPTPPVLPEGPWQVMAFETSTAWAGPWGISFTANLTPDRKTGLGKWTLRNFIETIRSGKHLGRGRDILPPMPIAMYKHMTDEDLEAIFTYLQSLPAISNQVPKPVPPVVAGSSETGQ
ncbi:MAG TPA: hypothetical protein VFG52_02135 [Xanthomonadales bacterium]|nr:hypothetical protein [Xanthomonadales bacterium]